MTKLTSSEIIARIKSGKCTLKEYENFAESKQPAVLGTLANDTNLPRSVYEKMANDKNLLARYAMTHSHHFDKATATKFLECEFVASRVYQLHMELIGKELSKGATVGYLDSYLEKFGELFTSDEQVAVETLIASGFRGTIRDLENTIKTITK